MSRSPRMIDIPGGTWLAVAESETQRQRQRQEAQRQHHHEEEEDDEEEHHEEEEQRNIPSVEPIRAMNSLDYPFKSKIKQSKYKAAHPNTSFVDRIPDKKIKPLKSKYMRPNFAPQPGSWEMDYIVDRTGSGHQSYLVLININTRYCYLFNRTKFRERGHRDYSKSRKGRWVVDKTITEVIFDTFIDEEHNRFGHSVNAIKSDDDVSFKFFTTKNDRNKDVMKPKYKRITVFKQNSMFTYHNKQVDALIRTLRNALGPNTDYLWDGSDKSDKIIQELVYYYNNTWHSAINMTPTEMHTDVDAEWSYIRKMTELLNNVKYAQMNAGLDRLYEGQRVMVHLEQGKTGLKYHQNRRMFEHEGTFVKYNNGNAVVKLDKTFLARLTGNNRINTIEIPLFFCIPMDDFGTNNKKRIKSTFNIA